MHQLVLAGAEDVAVHLKVLFQLVQAHYLVDDAFEDRFAHFVEWELYSLQIIGQRQVLLPRRAECRLLHLHSLLLVDQQIAEAEIQHQLVQ